MLRRRGEDFFQKYIAFAAPRSICGDISPFRHSSVTKACSASLQYFMTHSLFQTTVLLIWYTQWCYTLILKLRKRLIGVLYFFQIFRNNALIPKSKRYIVCVLYKFANLLWKLWNISLTLYGIEGNQIEQNSFVNMDL